MIRILLFALCSLILMNTAQAQRLNDGDRLWFSVAIEPDFILSEGTYVGGEMVMLIRLMSPDAFQRLRLDLPDIDGARTETLVRPHMRQLSSLGSMGYSDQAGYSYEARLSIIPEQSGPLLIPPIRVTGISQPSEGQAFDFQRTYPKQTITVHPLSADFTSDHWIVSRDVRIEQSWSPDLTSIKNGDTVSRSIVLTIAGVTEDDLPELSLGADAGFRALSIGITSESEKTDEGLIARLEQSWDIYVETEDVIHIDGFNIPYWNPETAQTEIASLPGQRVEPLPQDAALLREQLRDDVLAKHRAKSLGLMFLLMAPAAALLVLLTLTIWRALPTKADLDFWRASGKAETPRSFYESFHVWGQQTFGTRTVVDQQQIATLGGQATDHAERLHGSVFGQRDGSHQPRRTAAALIKASRQRATRTFISLMRSKLSRFLFLR